MELNAEAIICGARHHGEHGVIVKALTAEHGLLSGYVRGGRSREMRPVLMPGNRIMSHWRGRAMAQLPALTANLLVTRATLLNEPLSAAAVDWSSALTAAALPEAQPYPDLFAALSALQEAVSLSDSASRWAGAMARYELLLLARLGFGLSLERCIVSTSEQDLAFVSPRSGGAVSLAAAAGFEERLLPLPAFLVSGGQPAIHEALDGLRLSGYFIERRLFDSRRGGLFAARTRMVDRLKQMVA